MYSLLYRLGIIPLIVGLLVFLGTIGAIYIGITVGFLEFGVPAATALKSIGLPVAGAMALLAGCITALVSGRITAVLRKSHIENARNDLARKANDGTISDDIAMLQHCRINYEEVLVPTIVPEWLHGENRKNKDVLDIQEFICNYVIPQLRPEERPPKEVGTLWFIHWVSLIEELVGAYHRAAGNCSLVRFYLTRKLRPQRFASYVLHEFRKIREAVGRGEAITTDSNLTASASATNTAEINIDAPRLHEGTDMGLSVEDVLGGGRGLPKEKERSV